jgi:hypothetical protein
MWLIGSAVIAFIAIGAAVAVFFHSPAGGLVFLAICLGTALASRTLGWGLALATTLVVTAALFLYIAAISSHLPWSLATWYVVSAIGAFAVLLGLTIRRGLPDLSESQWLKLVCSAATPVVGGLAYVVWSIAQANGGMINAFLPVDSRLHALWAINVWEDHGIHLWRHNVAPFTSVMDAFFASERLRGLQRPADFGHVLLGIVQATHQLQILLWLLVVFLCSTIALRGVPRRALPWLAVVPGIMFAITIQTWFWMPLIGRNGAMNMVPSIVLIIAVWIVWLEHRRHPATAMAVMVLATVIGAALWAPVALIPFVFFWAIAVDSRSTLLRTPWRSAVPTLVAGLTSLAYLFGSMLPQLRETSRTHGDVLAFDGSIFRLPLPLTLLIFMVLGALVVVLRKVAPTVAVGLAVVLGTTLAVECYLLWTRRTADYLWGYYPIKFAWIVLAALLLIVAASVMNLALLKLDRMSVLACSIGVVCAVLLAVSPVFPEARPALKAFPVALAKGPLPGLSAFLTEVAPRHPKSLVYKYGVDDGRINLYLWTTSTKHYFAYKTHPGDGRNWLDRTWTCDYAKSLGPRTIVWTSKQEYASEFRSFCPGGDYTVRVAKPVTE